MATCILAVPSSQSYNLQAQSATASVGIARRVAWTTSRITGSPEAPLPHVTERAFPALKFNNCLDITTTPGSDRLFVVEQASKIFSVPSIPDVTTSDLVIQRPADRLDVSLVVATAKAVTRHDRTISVLNYVAESSAAGANVLVVDHQAVSLEIPCLGTHPCC